MEYSTNAPPGQGASTEAWARWYVSRGWPVFPIWGVDVSGTCRCRKGAKCPSPGKHPRTPQGVHSATTDPAKLERWKWSTANVGIATGSTSRLVVVDVDGPEGWKSYATLKEELGPLTESGKPATVTTSCGGAHAYVAYPEGLTIPSRAGIAPNVDIRADGGYVVAPPSRHASGHIYAFGPWIWPLPKLSPNWADFLVCGGCYTESTENSENTKRVQDIFQGNLATKKIEKIDVDPQALIDGKELQSIIKRTLPMPTRKRHDSIFAFARAIWSISELHDLPADNVEPLFQEWFKEALPMIGTKDYSESFLDFADAWEGVKYPEGFTPVESAWLASENVPPPKQAAHLIGKLPRVAAFCVAMQRECGGTNFFLSCQDLATCLDAKPMVASRLLNRLVKAGLLELVSKGNYLTKKASVYRWIGEESP